MCHSIEFWWIKHVLRTNPLCKPGYKLVWECNERPFKKNTHTQFHTIWHFQSADCERNNWFNVITVIQYAHHHQHHRRACCRTKVKHTWANYVYHKTVNKSLIIIIVKYNNNKMLSSRPCFDVNRNRMKRFKSWNLQTKTRLLKMNEFRSILLNEFCTNCV